MARRASTWLPKRPACARTSAREITCTNGRTYPLLVETREGYRNLCRLVTRMKLRAPKGEGAATLEEIAEFARGLICLTRHPDERLLEIFGRHISTPSSSATTTAKRRRTTRPSLETRAAPRHSAGGHQRRPPTPCPPSASCSTSSPASAITSRSKPPAGCWSATPSATSKRPRKWRACSPICPKPSPTPREISSRLEFTLADLGYEFPRYPVPEGETQMSFLRQLTERGRAAALPALSRARAAADRARAGAHRKAGPGRLFPDRLGHRALLPRARHPGAGPRLGRQQRRLLRARHHRRRSGGHGPALRALPLRRARRMARHRYRSAQRRQARARHPIRLPALRQAGRGHDRQRHHLSRPLRRARGGQGAGLRDRDASKSSPAWSAPGNGRIPRTPPSASSAKPAST